MSRVVIHPYYASRLKRAFDVVVAMGLLVGLSPLLVGLAGLIFLTAGQPVLYIQIRVGQGGRRFRLYKFRTMRVGAQRSQQQLRNQSEAPYPMFKLHNDPRFVGIGRLLSNTGLDELPQLWNILRGNMSLIGPRPLPPGESDKLLKLRPSWRFRLAVKPGIFSEWSLDQRRHQSLARWQKLDEHTVTQGGVWFELKLTLANTVAMVSWITRTTTLRILKLCQGKLSSEPV